MSFSAKKYTVREMRIKIRTASIEYAIILSASEAYVLNCPSRLIETIHRG